MIVGTGIDIVGVDRVRGVHARHGDRFLGRVYSGRERAESGGRVETLAGRFAAKEAVFKALGTGWGEGVAWREVEVVRGPGGAPVACLSGRALARAEAMGMARVHVSISHSDGLAVASAVGESR